MTSRERQLDVVAKLAENETTIGRLYEAYARRFPEYRQFWTVMASDEETHAQWIKGLVSRADKGLININEKRFNAVAIHTFLNYLEDEIANSGKPGASLISAISTALYIEESLIERKYFEVFEADSIELKQLLQKLDAATRDHVRKMREFWNRVKLDTLH